jgi:tetratricopeptide (TPR) repeat protein
MLKKMHAASGWLRNNSHPLDPAIAQHNQVTSRCLEVHRSAVQIAPQDPVTFFYKALILQRLGKSETALQILQQLLDLTTDPQGITRIRTEIDAIHFYLGNASSGPERKEE